MWVLHSLTFSQTSSYLLYRRVQYLNPLHIAPGCTQTEQANSLAVIDHCFIIVNLFWGRTKVRNQISFKQCYQGSEHMAPFTPGINVM